MYFQSAAIAALLLSFEVSCVIAKNLFEAHSPLSRRHVTFDELVRREAHEAVDWELRRRAPEAKPATPSASAAAAAQNFNSPEWNATTTAACTKALSTVTNTTNPAGMVACYNIPFLNNDTGVFEADLRLYQVGAMTGDFTGVQANQLSIALTYPDATVSASTSQKAKRAVLEVRQPQTTGSTVTSQASNSLSQLQDFTFVGQVDKALTLTKITAAQVQSLLIPTVQLSAPSPVDAKSTVTTNLTAADTLYFVSGVFAGDSASGAAAAKTTAIAAAETLAAPYILPGTTFGIFPIGFIVTGAWTVLFVAAVGYGTWGRMQFREMYRGRVKRAITGAAGKVPI